VPCLTRSIQSSTTLVVLALSTGTASARRAETTAAAEASDAFGLSVAGESIGLYSDKYVRGFSLVSAGNLRFDELYIDRQGEFVERVYSDVAIRVGVTALDTALPAPSGVADYVLRRPGDLPIGSIATGWTSFGSPFLEVDWAGGATEGLSLAAGASTLPDDNVQGGGDGRYGTAFISPTWTSASGLRVTGFASGSRYEDYESDIAYYTAGPIAPPEIARGRYLGQDWAGDTGTETNHGVIVDRAEMAGWTMKAGMFRSEWAPDREVFQYVDAITPDGQGVFGAADCPRSVAAA
jgi:iron complex outermembrane receptor protein